MKEKSQAVQRHVFNCEKLEIAVQIGTLCARTQVREAGGAEDDVFWRDIIAKVAAKHELGLQLLLMDVNHTAKNTALPGTLRYLFLSNR